MIDLHHAVRHLISVGGNDILVVDGALYEITARELDESSAAEAVQRLMREGKDDVHNG